MMFPAPATILVIGAGGLGCPVLRVLAECTEWQFRVVDDDVVELSNLHRQLLYTEADVGRAKVDVLAQHPRLAGRIEPRRVRFLPNNASQLLAGATLVIEGTDNFASKFLASDAALAARVPIVHAACVRWTGTVLAVAASGQPCYRCLFEDIPEGDAPNCAEAGILGPVAGAVGALAADAALRLLRGDGAARLWTFDGRSGSARERNLAMRADCTCRSGAAA